MTKVNLGLDTSGRPLVLDDTTLAKVLWAEAQLGIRLTMIQGSYRGGIGSLLRSGGTHDRGGAVDFRSRDIPAHIGIDKVLRALREAGLIAWWRHQSIFPDHEIHALDYGNPRLSRAAKKQVTAWKNGRNGLADNGPDDGPRVTIPKEVPVMGARIDGIDLSHYQSGALNLAKAKAAGVRWVFHKATEGTTYVDPAYDNRRGEVAKAGIPFGAYHFARPRMSNGKAQAVYFLAHAKPKPGDMRPMLDLEDAGGLGKAALTRWVGDFVAEVVAQTGQPCFIYTPFDLGKTFDCPLWVARYSNAMSAPKIPAPWKDYTTWQFSDGVYGHPNTVPGIGACDINTMNGDPAKLTDVFTLAGATPKKPKPKPKPKPPVVVVPPPVVAPEVPVEPTPAPLVVSVVSSNVKSNPKMPQAHVVSDIAHIATIPTKGAKVWFGQEIIAGRYTDAWTKGLPGLPYCGAQECPITLNPGDWTVEAATVKKMHNGLAHVTPARYLSTVKATSTARPDVKVAFVDTHFISGAWSTRYPLTKTWRQGRWSAHWVQLQDAVAALVADGYTVIAGADTNRSTMPPLHADQIVPVEHGIDHLWVIPAAGRTVKVTGKTVTAAGVLNTDHSAIGATLSIA